jgi:hypothetical protein
MCLAVLASCKKYAGGTNDYNHGVSRTIQFLLYTRNNFADNNHTITFTASIKDQADRVLWDSVMPSILIKNIPDFDHKINFAKTVNNNSILKVGFYYTIQDVGYSWFIDTCGKNTLFKTVDYNFQ